MVVRAPRAITMRVLCLTPGLGAGGAERQMSILLPGLRRRGLDARALALDSGGPFYEPLRSSGVPVEVLTMRHQLDLAPLMRSPLVRSFAPDVILSRGVSGLYVGHALAQWRGAGHVFNDHRGVGAEPSRRRALMVTALAGRLSGVIVVSEDQRRRWLKYGAPRERITVIPNGVELPAGNGTSTGEGRAQVRRELGIPESAVVALFVASLRPVKHAPDFVRMVLRARERCPELVGVVVGDGEERAAVERVAAGDPSIRLLGHRDDVPRILGAADVLALTSAHEAMPMSILEAMAAGLPVLATRVGGVDGVVVHGETGLLVAPGNSEALADGLVELARAPEMRLAMGRAGRTRCRERWDAEKMVDAYLEVIEQVAARRRRLPLGRAVASSFLDRVDRRGWVTWERQRADATVLILTNVWPEPDAPARAPFLQTSVSGLDAAGVQPDLLYLRGYRGLHCYLIGAVTMALLPLARPNKYRLVHSHGGETALAARCFWGAPVLATYWGSDILGLGGQGGLGERLRFAVECPLLRWHAMLMSATTTKTPAMERLLPRRARARNWVIPDGVDTARFEPMDRAQARAALGWATGEPAIITVGRRSAEKRVWLAEQVAALAAGEVDGLRWHAVSEVPPEQLPFYYNAADLLLHTAASEGSPNVIKEAMACNLPVLATPVGDIPDLLRGVQPSAVCEARPESLAREAVRLLRAGHRSNGRERIEPLRVEMVTAWTLECYRSLGAI